MKSYKYKKPSDGTLHILRNKYQYLKVLIVDEISVIGRETFGHIHLALKAIMQNFWPFGGVSLLVVGDFLQIQLVNQKVVFMKPCKWSYRSFNWWLWENFQLHGLVEIVRWSIDPDFAHYLIGFGKVSKQIIVIQIKALAITATATWPDESVKVYLDNYLVGQENEYFIGKLDSKVVVIKAQDGEKDIETNTCSISILDNIALS